MLKLLEIIYKAGKYLYVADTLSRAPVDPACEELIDKQLKIYSIKQLENLSISKEKLIEIKLATEQDEILKIIKDYHTNGWPKNPNKIQKNIGCFFPHRHDMHCNNGLLFIKNSLVIPESLRKDILNKIHRGHLGVNKCQRMARDFIFWPDINLDIHKMVPSCEKCNKFQNNNTKETLLPHSITLHPCEKNRN